MSFTASLSSLLKSVRSSIGTSLPTIPTLRALPLVRYARLAHQVRREPPDDTVDRRLLAAELLRDQPEALLLAIALDDGGLALGHGGMPSSQSYVSGPSSPAFWAATHSSYLSPIKARTIWSITHVL